MYENQLSTKPFTFAIEEKENFLNTYVICCIGVKCVEDLKKLNVIRVTRGLILNLQINID
jgi:hypothetical protein